ncbi:agmatinase [Desulfonispora thiosulfatigenes DSM 11270]|uniref:Agmatinase n=1 Tax=Desulfonispora thiosulfatigenes DSM 11270 TaxID=656914 RepID=A0A1W1VBG6_DESTI|nr:agmatinase [Desulfonispora thiosulfatigenes]SMB90636.1 agmatinase [Desulfonispora thiosulfatigenes DSM 11270]
MIKYKPANSLESPRFSGVTTFMRLPNVKTLEDVDFIVTGIPFDTACSYNTGSRFGPQAIRQCSTIIKPYNPVLDVNIFDYCSGVDYGDINTVPGYIEETYHNIEEGLTPVFEKGIIPIVMGGDHSITLAELRAAAKKYGPVALVQFDSHSDTYDSFFGKKYNHGTTFRRAIEENLLIPENSIQVGIRGHLYEPQNLQDAKDLGLEVITGPELHTIGIPETIKKIRERTQDKPIFVSFDIDFLDAAYAPGTGTPEIGGFTTWEAQQIVQKGLREKNVIGYDLVEVLPASDPSKITSFAAAGLMYEFISLIALNKKIRRG